MREKLKKINVFPASNFSNLSNSYRYTLQKGSKKYSCPYCAKKTFVRYVDAETDSLLPELYGRCDRQSKCAYHLNPYSDGYAKLIREQEQKVTGVTKVTVPEQKYLTTKRRPKQTTEPIFFDFNTFKHTLAPERYESNTFIQNLFYNVQFPFEVDDVTKVIQLYRLGTVANGYRAGANTFPFIDINGNVRAVQVKQFNEQNRTTGTDFLHSIIEKHFTRKNQPLPKWLDAYVNQDKRISCLFGEHLLGKYHSNPVALVESPKTAVYGALYFGLPETPESLIWLAVYNKSSFSFDKLKALQGRFIYVFPDLSKDGNTFKEWETKAKEYESRLPSTRFIFSDLLEHLAPERDKSEGYDLADYLIKQDWRLFRKRNIQENPQNPEPLPAPYGFNPYTGEVFDQRGYPADWDTIEPPQTGTPEADEIQRIWHHENSPADESELIALIADTFDAVPDENVSPDEIDAFWKAQDERKGAKAWRTIPN